MFKQVDEDKTSTKGSKHDHKDERVFAFFPYVRKDFSKDIKLQFVLMMFFKTMYFSPYWSPLSQVDNIN
jgi:hypothetical protein